MVENSYSFWGQMNTTINGQATCLYAPNTTVLPLPSYVPPSEDRMDHVGDGILYVPVISTFRGLLGLGTLPATTICSSDGPETNNGVQVALQSEAFVTATIVTHARLSATTTPQPAAQPLTILSPTTPAAPTTTFSEPTRVVATNSASQTSAASPTGQLSSTAPIVTDAESVVESSSSSSANEAGIIISLVGQASASVTSTAQQALPMSSRTSTDEASTEQPPSAVTQGVTPTETHQSTAPQSTITVPAQQSLSNSVAPAAGSTSTSFRPEDSFSDTSAVMQSSAVTIAPSPTPESTLQRTGVVTVGSDALTFTMLPSSGIAASGHTIQPGSPAVAVGGVTVSLGSGGTALAVANAQTTSTHAVTPATLLFSTGQVVGSQTVQAASALPTSSSTGASSAGLSVIIDGLSTTVAYAVPPAESLSSAKSTIMIGTSTVVLSQIMSGSAIVIGSQTVQAGGPAATIAGATVSVADDDSSVIVAESLFTATYALALPAQTSPPSENMITIGTSTVSISPLPSGSGVVVGSQTIKPNGSPVVIAGATVRLTSGSSSFVVPEITTTGVSTAPAASTGGLGNIIISGLNGPSGGGGGSAGSTVVMGSASVQPSTGMASRDRAAFNCFVVLLLLGLGILAVFG